MRTFGKDTPEFFEFKIAGRKKTYRIPTLASIGYNFNKLLAQIGTIDDPMKQSAAAAELQADILLEYIGEEAMTFPTEAVADLFTAWFNDTEETTGVSQGELQGSSE